MPATHYNTTPENQFKLYWAAYFGREEEVESLVSTRAAHPNTEDSTGCLALCGAAALGQTATVVTLARLGADVNLAQSAGDRDAPLGLAAYWGHTATVAKLLELGAVASQRNGAGKSPRDLALEYGHEQIAAVLERAEIAAQPGHADTVAALVQNAADPAAPAAAHGLLALDLSSQRLTALPAGVATLQRLKWLSLRDNALTRRNDIARL